MEMQAASRFLMVPDALTELTTNCSQLKLLSADGKHYKTDVADIEQLLRIIEGKQIH